MRPLLVLVLLLIATPALADDARVYAGATLEGGYDIGARSGVGLEVGVRPSASQQLWLRGHLVAGNFTPDTDGGRYVIAAVGLEGRYCAASGACLVGGGDVGGALLRWDRVYDSITTDGTGQPYIPGHDDYGVVGLPRIGAEFAARHVALRFVAQGLVGSVGGDTRVGATLTTSLLARF